MTAVRTRQQSEQGTQSDSSQNKAHRVTAVRTRQQSEQGSSQNKAHRVTAVRTMHTE